MRKALLSLVLLTLPARALAQQPHPPPALPAPPPLPAPSPIAVPSAPAVSDPMLAPVPPPKRILHSWAEAVTYLHARSTDLQIALDQVLQAEAQTRIALAQYLPSLQSTGAMSHQLLTSSGIYLSSGSASSSTTTYSGNLQLQQTIVNAQQFDQISIDELSEDASRMSVDDKKRTLALSLANQIVAVVTAERSADINRVGLKVALEQLEISRARRTWARPTASTSCAPSRTPPTPARRWSAATSRCARRARRWASPWASPRRPAWPPTWTSTASRATPCSRASMVPDVNERPDIAAARMNLEVAKRNLRNVYMAFAPTLNAQSTMTYLSPAPAFGSPNPTWNVQAILSIPWFDGGIRYGNLRNARAAEDIAQQNLESARRKRHHPGHPGARGLEVAEQSDKVATEQRDLAAQNDQMTQTAYMAGQGTSLELVTASEAHRQAELNLALADFNVVKARILAVLALATCPW